MLVKKILGLDHRVWDEIEKRTKELGFVSRTAFVREAITDKLDSLRTPKTQPIKKIKKRNK